MQDPEKHPYTLSTLSPDDVAYFKIINKYIIDAALSSYPANHSESELYQKIYTLKKPKARHRTLDNISRKLFNRPSKEWKLFENLYYNHKFKLNRGVLNILVKKNITKETNIAYYTTANQILKLQALGLTKSQALTSKVIEAIGQYNLEVEKRRVHSQITTNKTQLKRFLVKKTQSHIRLLQPIERLAYNFSHESLNAYQAEIRQTFTLYIQNIEAEYDHWRKIANNYQANKNNPLLNEVGLSAEELQTFLLYDENFFNDILGYTYQQLARAKEFLTQLHRPDNAEKVSHNLEDFLDIN